MVKGSSRRALEGLGMPLVKGRGVPCAEEVVSAEEAELRGRASSRRARGRARARCLRTCLRHDDADTHRRQVDPVGGRKEPARCLVTVVDSHDDPEGDHRGEGTGHRVLGHPDKPGQRACAARHLRDRSSRRRERGDGLEHQPADRAHLASNLPCHINVDQQQPTLRRHRSRRAEHRSTPAGPASEHAGTDRSGSMGAPQRLRCAGRSPPRRRRGCD